MNKRLRWYQSIAVKNNLVTFVATHVPLLGLIGLIVMWPGLFSRWSVFWTALALTLVSTVLVIAAQWRLFRPLRAAADGLKGFMTHGTTFQGSGGSSDEVGRMVTVLVQSLAHLDRGRRPLLNSGAVALGKAQAKMEPYAESAQQWFALVEIDDEGLLHGRRDLQSLSKINGALSAAMARSIRHGELAIPWGRGRVLLLLNGAADPTRQRVEDLCARIDCYDGDAFTASAVLEPAKNDDLSRAAALQRLEHRLFALRMQGAETAVV